jgi:UPF0755 protein
VNQQVSDLGTVLEQGRRRRPNRALGCLAVALALAVLLGGGYVAYSFGLSALRDRLRPPADYSGPGTGTVLVEVKDGDAASDIAATLKSHGVVKSLEAFTDAARDDPRSVTIQVGFYQLRKRMSAKAALAVLVRPANRIRSVVTVREGLRVDQIVDLLVKETDFTRRQYERVLATPRRIGLPSYAQGNPEGFLFPATYEIAPDATPRSILASMVKRYQSAVKDLDIVGKARALGYSTHDVMTVASIVQVEGRLGKDLPKIARVLYNRLEKDRPLQLDSTIAYIYRTEGKVTTTAQQRASSSPYNTYRHTGLPPTPISAPGEAAIEAALEPADGPWLYFVTIDPSTGETRFATTYAEHLRNVRLFRAYCRSNSC